MKDSNVRESLATRFYGWSLVCFSAGILISTILYLMEGS